MSSEGLIPKKTDGGTIMSYRLYGDLGSGAFSAEAALAEAGAPYEFELISLDRNEQKEPGSSASTRPARFRRCGCRKATSSPNPPPSCSPWPTIFPKAGLLPAQGAPARASAYRWLAFMASEIYPFVEIVDYPARFAPDGGAAEALREVARARLRERLLLLERVLAGPYLLAGGFSLLDIYAAMFSRWSVGRDWREKNLPRLSALADAVSRRPAIAPIWKKHFEKN